MQMNGGEEKMKDPGSLMLRERYANCLPLDFVYTLALKSHLSKPLKLWVLLLAAECTPH